MYLDDDERDQRRVMWLDYSYESLATLEACKELGYRVDEVRTINTMFDEETEGDHPEILKYKEEVNEFIRERYGAEVTRIFFPETYKELFMMDFTKQPGRMHGYPHLNGRWCKEVMKTRWMVYSYDNIREKYYKALPFERRSERVDKFHNIYPLIEMRWTHEDCVKFCEEWGLVAPRDDDYCWYCPFVKMDRMKDIKYNYPELWKKWLKLDNIAMKKWTGDPKTSPVRMKGRWWLNGFNKRFDGEKDGRYPADAKFRWKMLNDKPRLLTMHNPLTRGDRHYGN